jgi:hypothetical protein
VKPPERRDCTRVGAISPRLLIVTAFLFVTWVLPGSADQRASVGQPVRCDVVAYTIFRFPRVMEEVLTEGYVSQPVEPYEIPYRSLLPRQHQPDNLLVTSCISASSIAYASFRMEPQYMIAGHSAGTAAALAVRSKTSLHKLDLTMLQRRLTEQRQILSWEGNRP